MRDLGVFPEKGKAEQERLAMEIDEFERGYPRLTLSWMIDVVSACLKVAELPKREDAKGKDTGNGAEFTSYNGKLASPEGKAAMRARINSGRRPDSAVSWRASGKLYRMNRLKVFDTDATKILPLNYKTLLQPGAVAVIDLSDSGMSELTNIVIADLLRGVQDAQDEAYQEYEQTKKAHPQAAPPTRTLIIIEEAHEFLSAERIDKTKSLFEQVARIAKPGRKRLARYGFSSHQLPQHLPRQVFGLVNSYILHKITDADVVSALRRTVSGIDDGLWNRLSGLAPGQAIVSFPHMARPLLVSIDPTPYELRIG